MKKKNNRYDNHYYDLRNTSITKKQLDKKNKYLNEPDLDSEIYSKPFSPKKTKNTKNKNEEDKNQKLLGNKHKLYYNPNSKRNKNNEYINETKNKNNYNTYSIKSPQKLRRTTLFSDTEGSITNNKTINSNTSNYTNKSTTKKPKNNNIITQKKDEEENMVIFPFDFTKEIIEALSCEYCGGLFIRPYVINLDNCMHIFCLGCILKMLEDKIIGECFTCKAQFNLQNIKYSEVTDFYIKKFFPQIPPIIEENKKHFNQFMESEYRAINKDTQKYYIICELRPYKENIPEENRLAEIIKKNCRIRISINSDNDNVVNFLKKEIIKRLQLNLREDDIEIRLKGIEISQFQTFELLKRFLPNDENELVIFYYNKKNRYNY